jgi:hypothetical protein
VIGALISAAIAVILVGIPALIMIGRRDRDISKAQQDVNNMGKIMRDNEQRSQRRWLHGIASSIETSTTLDEAKVHAKLLKEEAWRN